MRLRVGARTDIGRVRTMNEDVHVVRADRGLFVVCDGMGGAAAGEVASRIAADAIVENLNGEGPRATMSTADHRWLPHTARLVAAVRRSNEVVYRQAKQTPDQADMGTTTVTAFIDECIASVAHVGDSRAYLWYDDQLVRLTCDHSLAGADNILIRALGREPEVDVAVSEVPLQPGDYLLLCSDGLTRMVPDGTMADAIRRLRNPQRICDHLVDDANSCGGTDNITVIVIELVGHWYQRMSHAWRRETGGTHDAAANHQV